MLFKKTTFLNTLTPKFIYSFEIDEPTDAFLENVKTQLEKSNIKLHTYDDKSLSFHTKIKKLVGPSTLGYGVSSPFNIFVIIEKNISTYLITVKNVSLQKSYILFGIFFFIFALYISIVQNTYIDLIKFIITYYTLGIVFSHFPIVIEYQNIKKYFLGYKNIQNQK